MKKSRFTESQIVAILKEGEAGVAVAQLTRTRDQRRDLLPLEVEVRRGWGARDVPPLSVAGRFGVQGYCSCFSARCFA